MNIIFGSKRLGQVDGSIAGTYCKYPSEAVITIEGNRGAGKGRRILFNKLASEKFDLVAKELQHIVFGTIQASENIPARVLISNVEDIANSDDLTSYKTSKNFITYDKETDNNTAERGKSIASSVITKEILSFLNHDTEVTREFSIHSFDMDGTSVFELVERTDKVESTIEDTHIPYAETTEVEEILDNEFNLESAVAEDNEAAS